MCKIQSVCVLMIGQLSDRLSYKAWMPCKCTEGNVHLFLFSQVMWSFSVVNVVICTMYYIKLNSCVCIPPLIPRYNKNSCRSERVMRESRNLYPSGVRDMILFANMHLCYFGFFSMFEFSG